MADHPIQCDIRGCVAMSTYCAAIRRGDGDNQPEWVHLCIQHHKIVHAQWGLVG